MRFSPCMQYCRDEGGNIELRRYQGNREVVYREPSPVVYVERLQLREIAVKGGNILGPNAP